jgi:mRNA interferase RelE/StbE
LRQGVRAGLARIVAAHRRVTDLRFRVDLAPAAQRQLRRLPPGDAARLRGPILALSLDPGPPGVMKVSGSDSWRLRVGELRVVYRVDEAAGLIVVLRVARRSESTYRGLER